MTMHIDQAVQARVDLVPDGSNYMLLEGGANNVYEVTTPDGKTVLIPVIDQCILAHDMKEKTVTVHLLPGLLDMN